MNPNRLQRRLDSFRYAFRGLFVVLRTQPNAWFHLAAAVAVVALASALELDRLEWALLAACIAGVIAAEAMNTALEKLADATHPDQHPLVGQAKDAAAGAVLVTALGALVVGVLVLGPKLWPLLG